MFRAITVCKRMSIGLLIVFLILAGSFSAQASGTRQPAGRDGNGFFAVETGRLPILLAFAGENNSSRYPDNEFQQRYEHWQNLSPAEKKKLRNRMNQYKKMSPQDKEQYQQKLQQWKKLSPSEREEIQQALKQWHNLSPAQKEALRRRLNQ